MATEGQTTEDQRLTLEELSSSTLALILTKWRHVLRQGQWWDSIWLECGLCWDMLARYKDPKNPNAPKRCDLCSAGIDGWCKGRSDLSRLALEYHHNDVGAWLADVEKFLQIIDAIVASRTPVIKEQAEQSGAVVQGEKPKKKGLLSLFSGRDKKSK